MGRKSQVLSTSRRPGHFFYTIMTMFDQWHVTFDIPKGQLTKKQAARLGEFLSRSHSANYRLAIKVMLESGIEVHLPKGSVKVTVED